MADGAAAPKLRLFVAVELPEHVTTAVAEALAPLRAGFRALRWTDPAGWHLTLAFLGWVPAERLPVIEAAVSAAAAGARPFELALTGEAGSFGSGALWAGLRVQPALAELAATVLGELTAVVTVPDADRPFRPHLTLARGRRAAGGAREAAAAYRGPEASWIVERVVLMRSHLLPKGARYDVVGEWPLGVTNA